MKTKIAFGLLCVLLLTFLSSVAFVEATVVPPYGMVYTTNDDGDFTINFLVYENVHINWMAGPVGTTVQIIVLFEDNTPVALANGESGINVPQSSFDGEIYFTPIIPGTYTIQLWGANGVETKQVAVATVFVAPESALGSVMAIGAGFGAFGMVVAAKKGLLKRQQL